MNKQPTKTEQIFSFIDASPSGRSFSEIQRFIVELNGRNYDEMQTDSQGHRVRVNRGYWCTRLLGTWQQRGALQEAGFYKDITGRWLRRKTVAVRQVIGQDPSYNNITKEPEAKFLLGQQGEEMNADSGIYTAGIDVTRADRNTWGMQIEVHGRSKAEAENLRNRIFDLLNR